MGRKSKEEIIVKNLDNISKWIQQGMFEKDIFKRLGICKWTWEKYKKLIPDFNNVLINSREERNKKLVPELQNLLIRRARGYQDTVVEETVVTDDDGIKTTKKIITKNIPPDIAAIQICLKNFTKNSDDPWTDNPYNDKLKKERDEIEKKILENKANGFK